jgi:cytochrome c551/c552
MTRSRALALILLGAALAAAGAPAEAQAPGDAGRGRALFEQKQCGRCHQPRDPRGLGPALEEIRKPQGALELAGRIWNHAPVMFALLKQQGLEWPRIAPAEMADLMAYLQADAARDPAPDLYQGQVLLIRKGCLKCHRLRGEGGSVGIEFTQYHAGYQSPVSWATTIWNHSSRMAGHSARMGVLYPRFTADEMVNLFGFLKASAEVSPR